MKITKVLHTVELPPPTFVIELSKEEADYLKLCLEGRVSTSESRRKAFVIELYTALNF